MSDTRIVDLDELNAWRDGLRMLDLECISGPDRARLQALMESIERVWTQPVPPVGRIIYLDDLAQQIVALRRENAALHREDAALDTEIKQATRAIEELLARPQPQVDTARASAEHEKVRRSRDVIHTTQPLSPEMLRRRADQVATLDVEMQLWSLVLASGWDAAVTRVGEFYRDAWRSQMVEQATSSRTEARAAQVWWRSNVRYALAEGLDPEAAAWAFI